MVEAFHACAKSAGNCWASAPEIQVFPLQQPLTDRKEPITKVTFTQNEEFISIGFVVWQFWGRAAEAS
jgi:hypothetical protein